MTNKIETITDEMGVWKVLPNGGRDLIEPSESLLLKWQEEANNSPIVEPTQDEYMLELDYRVSVIELGV